MIDYRIVDRKAFFIVGFKKRISLIFTGENHQIDSLYSMMTDEKRECLLSINDAEPKGILSVSANFDDRTREGSHLDQYLGVSTTASSIDGFDVLPVPPSSWAVFPSSGAYPDALQSTWASIYSSWLKDSGYALTGGPEILSYKSSDTKAFPFSCEIWIPVRKKGDE